MGKDEVTGEGKDIPDTGESARETTQRSSKEDGKHGDQTEKMEREEETAKRRGGTDEVEGRLRDFRTAGES